MAGLMRLHMALICCPGPSSKSSLLCMLPIRCFRVASHCTGSTSCLASSARISSGPSMGSPVTFDITGMRGARRVTSSSTCQPFTSIAFYAALKFYTQVVLTSSCARQTECNTYTEDRMHLQLGQGLQMHCCTSAGIPQQLAKTVPTKIQHICCRHF